MNAQILAEFARRGIGAVVITLPDIEERTGRDLRAAGEQRLRVRIWTGRVENVATIADGDRFRRHARGAHQPARAPLRARGLARARGRRATAWSAPRSSTTTRASCRAIPAAASTRCSSPARCPARRGSPTTWPSRSPGSSYAQVGNYGTEATTDWRERFGFSHNQLTGHDDVLRLDYVTGNFDDVHAGFGSYEAPIFQLDRLRLRGYGGYSEYDASELGDPPGRSTSRARSGRAARA